MNINLLYIAFKTTMGSLLLGTCFQFYILLTRDYNDPFPAPYGLVGGFAIFTIWFLV